MKLAVILEPSEEGGFTALVPALPGCISEGKSRKEALKNIREAIQLYLEPVTVPAHRPILRSTPSHILKQARLSVDQFLRLT